ncbi:MAG: hypothetical protein LBV21_01860 [Candidatus Adiutrix sp.]|jgi:membrane protein implicated in regulation of membrane protease activity|nr:hypothetical protein [Candidatus Adiutrix sp.]
MEQVFNIEAIADFFFILAMASTILFILKLALFSFTGAHADLDLDVHDLDAGGLGGDSDSAFHFLSLQSILAFLMGFGWIGLAGLKQWGLGLGLSTALAVLVGGLYMFLASFLMVQVRKLNRSPKQDYNDALNRTGQAYTNFAPGSPGQVRIEINGKLKVTNALNTSGEAIRAFERIKVVRVENNMLHIQKPEGVG